MKSAPPEGNPNPFRMGDEENNDVPSKLRRFGGLTDLLANRSSKEELINRNILKGMLWFLSPIKGSHGGVRLGKNLCLSPHVKSSCIETRGGNG
jgi:hypothetical protein